MTANAGDLMELTKDNLPISSISVFITGFFIEHIQNDNVFKGIKIAVNEFTGGGNTGKKFYIKCRYLKTDIRIDVKVQKIRKNSSVLVVGELVLIGTEFQVEIQDLNFLPMSIASIDLEAKSSTSSSYSWPSLAVSSGRITAQEMANTHTPESLTTTQPLDNTSNEIPANNTYQQSTTGNEDCEDNDDISQHNSQASTRGRGRGRKRAKRA
jgi:hypothetical protein